MIEETVPNRPEAGYVPEALAGREVLLWEFARSLALVGQGRYARGMMILGMQNLGKSTILNKMHELVLARERRLLIRRINVVNGSITAKLEDIVSGRDFSPSALDDPFQWLWWVAKAVFYLPYQGYVWIAKWELPEPPKFYDQLSVFGMLLKMANLRLVVMIDDIHLATTEDLQKFRTVCNIAEKESLPILFVATGLPQSARKQSDDMVRLARYFNEHILNKLTLEESKLVLDVPAKSHGRAFSPEALERIVTLSDGFPYMLQLFGSMLWGQAKRKEFSLADFNAIWPKVKRLIVRDFLQSMKMKLDSEEKEFVLAIAAIPLSGRNVENLHNTLGDETVKHDEVLNRLIDKHVVYENSTGILDFTAPLFGEYMLDSEGFVR